MHDLAPGETRLPARSRRRRIVYAALGLALAGLAASQVWVLTGRQGVVEKGRLYRSAALSPDRLARVCAEHGIRTVIDFRRTESDARAEALTLASLGVRSVHLPSAQVPSEETVAAFLGIMRDTRGEPVLIHCRHGVGRAGVFAAVYRMEFQGWSPRRAWLEAMLYSGFTSYLPGSPKAEFILSYRPRRGADRATGLRP